MKNLLYTLLLFVPLFGFSQNTNYVEQDSPLNLVEGWNMFGYSCYDPMDVVEAFSPIVDRVLLAKDGNGSVYLPEYDPTNSHPAVSVADSL